MAGVVVVNECRVCIGLAGGVGRFLGGKQAQRLVFGAAVPGAADDTPHAALRVYVMGERASRLEMATPEDAAQMRALGCDRRVISADEAVKLEPALRHIRPQLAGATYTAEDESGDANQFARELVKRCEAAGVQFLMSHTVTALREAAGRIDHVEATDSEGRFQRIRADAYVLAMGSLSPIYAQPLGIVLPINVYERAGQATFNGEMAAELTALVDAGVIRILDLVIIAKDEDGSIEGFEIDDFEQLAGLVCALDAVVTVQTAVAHLTGAIGRPGLVMIPRRAEWRYGAAGEDIPWYGSLRLLRQTDEAGWRPVIDRVIHEIEAMAPVDR